MNSVIAPSVRGLDSQNIEIVNLGDQNVWGYCIFSSETEPNYSMADQPWNTTYRWGANVLVPKANGVTDFKKSAEATQAIIDVSGDNSAAAAAWYSNPEQRYYLPTTEGYLKMEQVMMPINPAIFNPYNGLTFWTSTEADDDEAWYVTISVTSAWTVTRGLKSVARYAWPITTYIVNKKIDYNNYPGFLSRSTTDGGISEAASYLCLQDRFNQIYP